MSKKSKQQEEEQEQEQVWTEIFNMFDKDKNGHITRDELGHVLRALDMDPTKKELDDAVKELDKDGNGIIEYHDFRAYMLRMKRQSLDERKQEMIRAFRMMDKNNDKFIDAHELMSVLTSLGEPLTKEEVEAMIKVADVNKDGKIDYEEFVEFILSPFLQPTESKFPSRRSKSKQSDVPMHSRTPTNQTLASQGSTGFFYTADTRSSASSLSYQSRSWNESMTSPRDQDSYSNKQTSTTCRAPVEFALSEKDENDNEFLTNRNDVGCYQKSQTTQLMDGSYASIEHS